MDTAVRKRRIMAYDTGVDDRQWNTNTDTINYIICTARLKKKISMRVRNLTCFCISIIVFNLASLLEACATTHKIGKPSIYQKLTNVHKKKDEMWNIIPSEQVCTAVKHQQSTIVAQAGFNVNQ